MTARGSATVMRADALALPIADKSVDLIVTSPPYFALRSYQDGGEHYGGQIGSEATPQAFLQALWAVMAECWRVLKPTGSVWVNLGDKYAGSGGHNNWHTAPLDGGRGRLPELAESQAGAMAKQRATRRNAPDRYNQTADVRPKSLMGLPWSFANGCIGAYPFPSGLAAPDGQRWILRAEVVWDKPNGLPESVTDRVRRSHEQWFHFVKSNRYFSALDEIREEYNPDTHAAGPNGTRSRPGPMAATWGLNGSQSISKGTGRTEPHPLGKLPGSVWSIPSEPLTVPEHIGVDHFAAFPTEWPRRIILGWSPSGICVKCGEGRVPVVNKELHELHTQQNNRFVTDLATQIKGGRTDGLHGPTRVVGENVTTITGYACACPEPTVDTRPAVVLDPFGGTGTVAMVAKALGRIGITVRQGECMSEFDYVRASLKISGEAPLPRTHNEYEHGDEIYVIARMKVHEVAFPEDKDGVIERVHKSKAEAAFVVDAEQAEKLIATERERVSGQGSIDAEIRRRAEEDE